MAEFNQFGYGQPETFEPMMWVTMEEEAQTTTNYDKVPLGTTMQAQTNTTVWIGPDKSQHVQQVTEFDFGLDTTGMSPLDMASPSSGINSHHRRTSTVYAEIKDSIPEKVERRREQNRASQRAYRDRKEKHQQELEQQIAQWKDKHRDLTDSLAAQTAEVSRLKAQIEDLQAQILSLQVGRGEWGHSGDSPSEFDLVPFNDRRSER